MNFAKAASSAKKQNDLSTDPKAFQLLESGFPGLANDGVVKQGQS